MDVIKVKKNTELYDIAINLLKDQYDQKNRGDVYWRKRFNNPKLDFIGFLLKIDSKYVGFLGTIGSKEMIGLSVWYVNPEYRKNSLYFLIKAIKNLEETPIINSSPNPTALRVFVKLKGFNLKNEFIGLPKKIFGYNPISNLKIYEGNKLNIIFNEGVSLIDLLVICVKYKKLFLALSPNKKQLLISKKINIVFKNINYDFPLSIYGDVFE